MKKIALYLRWLVCVPRVLAAISTNNWRALDNTIRDIEGYSRLLGHEYDERLL